MLKENIRSLFSERKANMPHNMKKAAGTPSPDRRTVSCAHAAPLHRRTAAQMRSLLDVLASVEAQTPAHHVGRNLAGEVQCAVRDLLGLAVALVHGGVSEEALGLLG